MYTYIRSLLPLSPTFLILPFWVITEHQADVSALYGRFPPAIHFTRCCCCAVAKSCLTLGDPMDTPVFHCLWEFAQIHVHGVSDACICHCYSPNCSSIQGPSQTVSSGILKSQFWPVRLPQKPTTLVTFSTSLPPSISSPHLCPLPECFPLILSGKLHFFFF